MFTCHDKQLSGEWISLDGVKRFPVSAIRGADGSYNTRRLAALKPIQALAKIVYGVKFETVSVGWPKESDPKVSGVLLLGSESAIV